MFAAFTVQLYTTKLYNKFKTYISVSIFVQYVVYTVDFMFQYMSPTLLQYQGTLIIEFVALGLFVANSLAFLVLSIYEAVVRLRQWVREIRN
jgi:hypothetical protein